MKNCILFFFGFCFFSVGNLIAQNNFENLFNGKDLSGWEIGRAHV